MSIVTEDVKVRDLPASWRASLAAAKDAQGILLALPQRRGGRAATSF